MVLISIRALISIMLDYVSRWNWSKQMLVAGWLNSPPWRHDRLAISILLDVRSEG